MTNSEYRPLHDLDGKKVLHTIVYSDNNRPNTISYYIDGKKTEGDIIITYLDYNDALSKDYNSHHIFLGGEHIAGGYGFNNLNVVRNLCYINNTYNKSYSEIENAYFNLKSEVNNNFLYFDNKTTELSEEIISNSYLNTHIDDTFNKIKVDDNKEFIISAYNGSIYTYQNINPSINFKQKSYFLSIFSKENPDGNNLYIDIESIPGYKYNSHIPTSVYLINQTSLISLIDQNGFNVQYDYNPYKKSYYCVLHTTYTDEYCTLTYYYSVDGQNYNETTDKLQLNYVYPIYYSTNIISSREIIPEDTNNVEIKNIKLYSNDKLTINYPFTNIDNIELYISIDDEHYYKGGFIYSGTTTITDTEYMIFETEQMTLPHTVSVKIINK